MSIFTPPISVASFIDPNKYRTPREKVVAFLPVSLTKVAIITFIQAIRALPTRYTDTGYMLFKETKYELGIKTKIKHNKSRTVKDFRR